jgi:hypothetical protein
MYSNNFTLADFKVGDRIQMHPGTDQWMMGARYGNVTRIGKHAVQVKLDLLTRPLWTEVRRIVEIL